MDLQTVNGAISQIRKLLDSRTSTVARIDTKPDKPAFRDMPVSAPFARATPESKGVPPRLLADYYRALGADGSLDMHSVTVIKDGAVIAEGSYGAYDRNVWHVSYSACKSIVGLAVGMLADEGRISPDDKVAKLFGNRAPRLSLLALRGLMVRHLLTMSSGAVFNEAGAVTETDWVKCFLESTPIAEPGEKFMYNSMNTYMLSAIVREVTGESLADYLRPRLWEPLDITQVFWEKCPMGIEKGGWGLYMRQEDFAKIGQLVLQMGQWNGGRLVSRAWVEAATSRQMETPASCGDYDYGYHIWVGRDRHSFLFSGMFDQNVLGFFDTDVLVACNAGNGMTFQQSDFYRLTHEALGRDFPQSLPEDPEGRAELERTLRGIVFSPKGGGKAPARRRVGLPLPCAGLDGKVYSANTPNAATVGLFPLIAQAFQNNYTKGLKSLAFSVRAGRFFLTVNEADERYVLPVGFFAPEYADLSFHGEPHRVGVTGRFAEDEDGRSVLVLRVSFLETASARLIRIYFNGDGTLLSRWSESPGRPFMMSWIDSFADGARAHHIIGSLIDRADRDFLDYKVRLVLEPEVGLAEKNE